jgi:hypothetical protein
MAISRRHGRAHDQARSMLQQHMAQVAEACFAPARLLIQARVGIGRRLMGRIAPASVCATQEVYSAAEERHRKPAREAVTVHLSSGLGT